MVPGGWLVKIEEDIPDRKRLLNPLSRQQLNPLPSNFPRVMNLLNLRICELGQEYVLHHVNYKPNSSSFSDAGNLYMEKVVMILLNFESDFMLLTIHVSGKLALFRSGDRRWTIIKDMTSPYDDVIVYKGNFYAVDNTGRTVVVGLNSELSLIANPVFGGDKKYLVESNGELLLVDMYLSIDTGEESLSFGEEYLEHLAQYMSERTVRFKVYKLDEQAKSWIVLKSLGDRVLFLGDDSTFAATASDLSGCEGNCIFFVDNFFYARDESPAEGDDGILAGRDVGVYDFENGCIGPLVRYPEHARIFWPPPHWITMTSLEVSLLLCYTDMKCLFLFLCVNLILLGISLIIFSFILSACLSRLFLAGYYWG